MKNELRKKLSEHLDNLAFDVQESLGSYCFWGEVEVPECLRKELEQNNEAEQ